MITIKVLDIEVDGDVVEESYFSELLDGELVWTSILAIDLAEPVHLPLDAPAPPVGFLRDRKWIPGRIVGLPQPPNFRRMFILVPKKEQNG